MYVCGPHLYRCQTVMSERACQNSWYPHQTYSFLVPISTDGSTAGFGTTLELSLTPPSFTLDTEGGSPWTAALGYRRRETRGRMVSGLPSRVTVFLLVLLQGTQSVYIQYQGFQVQLESVKRLSDLEEQRLPNPHLQTQRLVPPACHHPALPQDLQPICASKEADSVFQALRTIANDDCELCVNVACTGCL
ncbi:guanylate cyclase activator 2B [Hyaena hyaena]|uniref:guanylate cyclase activator 2B n=1 Tax=Hyaena hyaena TaxID=95912 RepID=UPI001923C998|nr:guanylate cyclase activator 2B [Hyaena hyaena]